MSKILTNLLKQMGRPRKTTKLEPKKVEIIKPNTGEYTVIYRGQSRDMTTSQINYVIEKYRNKSTGEIDPDILDLDKSGFTPKPFAKCGNC